MAALLLVPLILLGGAECILRLAGYGHPTGVFKHLRIGDREYMVNDDRFGLRFFPPEQTRSPSAFRMESKKPADTYRIFILGESAAMGDPEPAYGPARYLEVLLRERFPGQNFELINLGITAINSHVILPIARECARYEGDLWIIYMGNNEMVGPFGAATVFGAQAPPLAFVRANLAIQRSRVGQLVMEQGRKLKKSTTARPAWGGMGMFVENKVGPDDPRRDVVAQNFESNLRDILRAGLNSGAKVILSTVAVNLRDCPPFASISASNLPSADAATRDTAVVQGLAAEQAGKFTDARILFERAEGLDPKSAEIQFHWGTSLFQGGNSVEGRRHLQLACDYDALPFRTDSRLNDLIRQAGAEFAGRGLELFDAAGELEAGLPGAACGAETFYEHVHFDFDGSYRLARTWAGKIETVLQAGIRSLATPDWISQAECERRLGLTDWNRTAVIESVLQRMSQAPFNAQFNHAARLQSLRTRVANLRQRMSPASAVEAGQVYLEAIQAAPEDYYVRENYAAFLVSRGELKLAEEQWRRVHELVPQDFIADFRLGELLAREGRLDDAEPVLREALTAHPGFTEAWMKLGEVHAGAKKLDLALSEYERARYLQPRDPSVHYELGRIYSRLNRSPESIHSFQEALRLKPDYWEAHYTLGGELGMHDRVTEARAEFEETVRLQPDFAMGHLNLGVALLKENRKDEARRQFEETLRQDPANKVAADYLQQTRGAANGRP